MLILLVTAMCWLLAEASGAQAAPRSALLEQAGVASALAQAGCASSVCTTARPAGAARRDVQRAPRRWGRSSDPAVTQDPCPDPLAGATCGHVNVPLDRAHPALGRVPIFFALLGPTQPGPPQSAILVNFGGPGLATTGPFVAPTALQLLAGARDHHALLLIDDRGRGLSGTIDCPELQHGTAPFDAAQADCAAMLGRAATLYGTGDIAQDTDAVRAALGFDKVDYFGLSYGGADATAYATRFGKHVRSIVLDSPIGGVLDSLQATRTQVRADIRMVRLDCRRSPTCAADHPDPVAELNRLVRRIQAKPVEGDAHDANGQPVHVRIDELTLLLDLIQAPTGNFASTGELLAAASSLRHGDPAPLLRLGAEQQLSIGGDAGDPTQFSVGALRATVCVDFRFPWDWSAPVAQRQAQYDAAVRNLPADYFAPFTREAPASALFQNGHCASWEKPRPSSPVVPPHAAFPHVPVLVLSGDLDNRVPLEQTRMLAGRFPDSVFLTVAEAGHGSVFASQCAADLAVRFIETEHVGDPACAQIPEVVFPATGRFALTAADARPAAVQPNAGNQIGRRERKVVTVAVAAATDALQRLIIGSGTGVGLRGGRFTTAFGDQNDSTTTLDQVRFARDVSVSGTVHWSGDNTLDGELHIGGSGTVGGTIHVTGSWQAPGPLGDFTISGTIGGRRVAVLVAEQ